MSTVLSTELLKSMNACSEGISFFERNNLHGFPLDKIFEVKGDFLDFVSFIKERLNNNYTYDSNGNPLIYKSSNGYSWEKTYDFNGNELTYKDSNGYSWEKTYDSNGNVLTYKSSYGDSWEKTYDSNGNVLTHKNSGGYSWEMEYIFKNEKLHQIIQNGEVLLEIPEF